MFGCVSTRRGAFRVQAARRRRAGEFGIIHGMAKTTRNAVVVALVAVLAADSLFAALPPRPEPPPKSEWGFVRELATPPVRTPKERFRLVDDYGRSASLDTAIPVIITPPM